MNSETASSEARKSKLMSKQNTPSEDGLTENWEELARDKDHTVRLDVANNSACPADILRLLSRDKEEYVRSSVAENSACPADILRLLSRDKDEYVRIAVAENSACPADILRLLSRNKDEFVRLAVAKNSTCPVDILERLAEDKSEMVRRNLAENSGCPVSILERLAQDKANAIRFAVARNPACPVPTLELLSRDKGERVRSGVASISACPASILERLSRDDDMWVRSAVARNPACPVSTLEQLAMDEDDGVRASIAQIPACPISILERLAEDKVSLIRAAVAGNLTCPASILELLASDKDRHVRDAVARNPSCPVSTLERLAMDEDDDIRASVGKNPASTVSILERLAGDRVTTIRSAVANLSVCPEYILVQLARDKDKYVRAEVAKHPACPEGILGLLSTDEDAYVRSVVSENPACPRVANNSPYWVAMHGSKYQQLELLRDPGTPKEILSMLSPEYFYNDAMHQFEDVIKSKSDPKVKSFLKDVMKTGLPYCMPKFLRFDLTNRAHRRADLVLGGFPFTSNSWPWPRGMDGENLQPIAQINLTHASKLLATDLGDGLLQVWFDNTEGEAVCRTIPFESTLESMDELYPEIAPWLDGSSAFSGPILSPRIEWIPMGCMFPIAGSAFHGTEMQINFGNKCDDEGNPVEDIGDIEEQLRLVPSDLYKYFSPNGSKEFVHLGGYNYRRGNSSGLCDYPETVERADFGIRRRALLSMRDDTGILTLVVTFEKDSNGNVSFDAGYAVY